MSCKGSTVVEAAGVITRRKKLMYLLSQEKIALHEKATALWISRQYSFLLHFFHFIFSFREGCPSMTVDFQEILHLKSSNYKVQKIKPGNKTIKLITYLQFHDTNLQLHDTIFAIKKRQMFYSVMDMFQFILEFTLLKSAILFWDFLRKAPVENPSKEAENYNNDFCML